MTRQDPLYQSYVRILKEELIPAMGCTEPIAIAYAAAAAAELLGKKPDEVSIGVSESIFKNARSVIVPNTRHMKGVPAAAAAGIVAGDASKKLEVISDVSEEDIAAIHAFCDAVPIAVTLLDTPLTFDIVVTLKSGGDFSKVRIAEHHTNLVYKEKNGEVLLNLPVKAASPEADASASAGTANPDRPSAGADSGEASSPDAEKEAPADRSLLTMASIYDFAESVDIADVKEILDRQIACNMAIAEEGLKNNYGANIGSTLMRFGGTDISNIAKATAAAGADARMDGCEMPVIINSGSGNQGLTVSVPVIIYARHLGVSDDKLYRALTLSNLTSVRIKTPIGTLSAYCGAVSAGAAAGAGVAYLSGGGYEAVIHTVVNALAIVSGIVCDGAKSSCAAKIVSAVEAGIFGYQMFLNGQQFYGGDGILRKGVEETLENIGDLGRVGMEGTNKEIVRLMLKDTDAC